MTAPDFPVTIFHNPACGTSRNVVAMVEAAGYAPTVVDYLQAGWTVEQLRDLAARAGLTPRDLLREKGTPAAALGLLDDGVGEDRLLEAMVAHRSWSTVRWSSRPRASGCAAPPKPSSTSWTASPTASPRKTARS